MRITNQTPQPMPIGKGRWKIMYRTVEGNQTSHSYYARTKTEAKIEADKFIEPINQARRDRQKSAEMSLGGFVQNIYIPFGEKKWKPSTASTTTQRLRQYFVGTEIGKIPIGKLDREVMQAFLTDKKLAARSVVNHLRFDLHAILRLAIADGLAPRNQAEAIYTPRTCAGPKQPVMTLEEVHSAIACLDIRERLFCRFAIYAGMRPGEIIALRWSDINDNQALIDKRFYKGLEDSPKGRGEGNTRTAVFSQSILRDLEIWRAWRRGDSDFIFPSENPESPIKYENLLQRHIQPRFRKLGLGWADFRCMRRTNSTLMKAAGADVKVSADQRGHGVNVALSEYTHSTIAQKAEAVGKLEELIN